MLIEVTKEDISSASGTTMRCPIARALLRTTNQLWSVWPLEALAFEVFTDREIELPFEAARFARQFDAGRRVKPFSFQAEIVE